VDAVLTAPQVASMFLPTTSLCTRGKAKSAFAWLARTLPELYLCNRPSADFRCGNTRTRDRRLGSHISCRMFPTLFDRHGLYFEVDSCLHSFGRCISGAFGNHGSTKPEGGVGNPLDQGIDRYLGAIRNGARPDALSPLLTRRTLRSSAFVL
jgi:hypothetical protein